MALHDLIVPVRGSISLHTLVRENTRSTNTPAVLLLHFWGGSNETFTPLIEHIDAGIPIIAPSLRGWGKSSKPSMPDSYTISEYAADIVALMEHLRSQFPGLLDKGVVVLGHSMGGKIAQALITMPEMDFLINGMILVAPAPSSAFSLPGEMKEQQIHAYDSIELARFAVRDVLLGSPLEDTVLIGLASGAVDGAADAKQAWPTLGMAEDFSQQLLEGLKRRDLAGQELKVLVIAAAKDRVETVPDIRQKTCDVLSASGVEVDFQVLDTVGHLIPLEAPSELWAIMNIFLSGMRV